MRTRNLVRKDREPTFVSIVRARMRAGVLAVMMVCTMSGCGFSVSTNSGQDSKPSSPNDLGEGDRSEPGPIVPSGCGTISLPEYPKFISIRTIYPDPDMLLTIPDTTAALYRLKAVASPTTEYQAELSEVVIQAKTIDVIHLLMLLRAGFFGSNDFDRVRGEIKATEGQTDEESCRRRALAVRDSQMMNLLQGESAMMLNLAVAKLAGEPKWEDARAILTEAMPGRSLSEAFINLFGRFQPLTVERLREAMSLADSKLASDAAGGFAYELFTTTTDKRFDSLLALGSELRESSREALFLRAIGDFATFTIGQIFSLISASGSNAGKIAGFAVDRLESFSHANVIQIVSRLDDRERGEFLAKAVGRYEKLTMKEMKELIGSTSHERGTIATIGASKVADVSVTDVVWVAGEINGEAKDKWIASTIEKLDQVKASEVAKLMDETYYGAMKVAIALKDKISDLDVGKVVLIAAKLAGANRDEWLELTTGSLQSVSTLELTLIMDAAYYGAFPLAKSLRTRLSDPTLTNLLLINSKLGGQNRDEWIKMFLPEFERLETRQVIEVMRAAYYASEWVATNCLNRISDFGVEAIVGIGKEIGGRDRDRWINKALSRLESVTSREVMAIMTVSYDDALGVTMGLLPITTDLNVANAVQIVAKLGGRSRDDFLLKAVDFVVDLDESNLQDLVVEAHTAADRIKKKGEKRLKASRSRD